MTVHLTLGPIQYNWSRDRRLAFYQEIAASAVDTVVLGETVCFRRTPFLREAIAEEATLLLEAGKRVVMSTLALAVSAAERADVAALCGQAELLTEANDAGALYHLRGRPHWAGPFLNTYSPGTVAVLAANGAEQVCLPWELSLDSIRHIGRDAAGLRLEAPVFGRVPLAISARCYHARVHGLNKDGCQYVCDRDPAGMTVETLEGADFLRVNGVQTLSGAVHAAIHEVPGLLAAGVESLRLMPEAGDMRAVIAAFRAVTEGQRSLTEAEQEIRAAIGGEVLCNGFLHGVDGTAWVDSTAA